MFEKMIIKLQRTIAARLYRRSARSISKLESQQCVNFTIPPENDLRVQSIEYMIGVCKEAQDAVIVAQLATCLHEPSSIWKLIRTAYHQLNHVDEMYDDLSTPAR